MASDTSLRPGFWMTAKAWLDTDGRHVWVAHDCTTERVVTMLPWPVWHSDGLKVEPSFSCDGCGVHTFVMLGVPDESHRCMETFEHDGRWCERMVGHGGLHRTGMLEWGSYVRSDTADELPGMWENADLSGGWADSNERAEGDA